MNPLLRDELAAILAESKLPTVMPTDVQFQPIDVSPRALKIREIFRIAEAHQWHSAVYHFLAMKGVSYPSDLSDPQLEDLLQRMEGYVESAELGCSLPDCLPAA